LTKENIIPETVYSYTSVSLKTTRNFTNKLGNFTYKKIKEKLFTGYYQKDYFENCRIKIATRAKALFDFLYFKTEKTLRELGDFRINWQNITSNDLDEFSMYIDMSQSAKMKKAYTLIKKEYDKR